MRLNPNDIKTPRQARALQLAQYVMKTIDTGQAAVESADNTSDDFNHSPDQVLLSGFSYADPSYLGRRYLYEAQLICAASAHTMMRVDPSTRPLRGESNHR